MPRRQGKPNELVRILERIRLRQDKGADTLEHFAETLGVGLSTYLSWRGVDEKPPRIPERSTMRLIWRSVERELRAEGYETEDDWVAVRDRLAKRRGGMAGGGVTLAALALFMPIGGNLGPSCCHPSLVWPGTKRGVRLATRRGRSNLDRRGNGTP